MLSPPKVQPSASKSQMKSAELAESVLPSPKVPSDNAPRSQIQKPPASGNRKRSTTPSGSGSRAARACKPVASRQTLSDPQSDVQTFIDEDGLPKASKRLSSLQRIRSDPVAQILSDIKKSKVRTSSAPSKMPSHWRSPQVDMFMDEDERRIDQFRAKLQHVLHDGIQDSAALVGGRHASIESRKTGIQVKIEYFRESFPKGSIESS